MKKNTLPYIFFNIAILHSTISFTMPENVSELIITTQSKIDICCTTLNSQLNDLTNVFAAGFEGTFTVIDTIQCNDNSSAAAQSKLDSCCTTLNSTIDAIQETVINDFAGTFSVIAAISCGDQPCAPLEIVSATSITEPGNYCLNQDILGNIDILSSNVTLNLNSFNIDGMITIDGSANSIIIKNGSMNAAVNTGIESSGSNVTIENMVIENGPDSKGDSAPCIGIAVLGVNTIIKNCKVILKAAGNGNDGGMPPFTDGNPGGSCSGVYNSGSNTTISNCLIIAGDGGNGGAGSNQPVTSNGGNGGASIGIWNFSPNLTVINSKVYSSLGGNAGNGNNAPPSSVAGSGGNGGLSAGIVNNASRMIVLQSQIGSQNGGTGGPAGFALADNGSNGGNGGNGGDSNAIQNNSNRCELIECIIMSGSGGNAGNGSNGSSGSPMGNGGNGGNGGNSFAVSNQSSSNIFPKINIIKCFIKSGNCGSGGNGGHGGRFDDGVNITYGTGGTGGYGGTGFAMSNTEGNAIQIIESTCSTSSGGNGGNGGNGNPGGNAGIGSSNDAIFNTTNNFLCIKNSLQTGDGGNGGNGGNSPGDSTVTSNGGNGGDGGNGGQGVHLNAGSNCKVRQCTVNKTGIAGIGNPGGAATGGGVPGTNGVNGTDGNGILLRPTTTFSEVNDCIFMNIPSTGNAITDNSLSGVSMIFTNFAFTTTNAYSLNGANAVDSPNGSAFAAGTNRLANVYQS
jgi:hypothetical protein